MKVKHLVDEKHKSIGILKSSGYTLKQMISDLSAKREALLAELKQVEEALSQAQQEESCRRFPPVGSHQRVKLVCVLPFLDGDAKRHKDLSWFGQEKALRPAGGSLYYSAPKCLYRGEYKRGMDGDGVSSLCYVWLVCCVVSRCPLSAPGSPLL